MNKDISYQIELEMQQQRAFEIACELERMNKKLAKMRLDKEQLEAEFIELIGHNKEGSKTYDIGDKSVTVKTEMIYSLDKKAYTGGEVFLPTEFDPVLTKISYEVNKKLFKAYEEMAPESVRDILNQLIEIKPAKPALSIKARI